MSISFNRDQLLPIGIGVASFAAGAVAGYIFRAKSSPEYSVYVHNEAQAKEFEDQLSLDFESIPAVEETVTPEVIELIPESQFIIKDTEAQQVVEVIEVIPVGTEDAPVAVSIFTVDDPGWNLDEELAKRAENQGEPYIVHRDEFYEVDEETMSRTTLMYYQGDNVLCDEDNTPLYGADAIVGELNFGHGSNDPSICYVRNDEMESQFEVILDSGYFLQEVLGEEIEADLQHADMNRSKQRKFRE